MGHVGVIGEEVGITSVLCYFPDGWAAANEEFLWELQESDAEIRATGQLREPEHKVGVMPAELIRSGGLNNCTLERVE